MATESKCPVDHGSVGVGQQNDDWWPNQLNLRVLPHGIAGASPMGDDFDYATEFESLDLAAVKALIDALLEPLDEAERLEASRPSKGLLAGAAPSWVDTKRSLY